MIITEKNALEFLLQHQPMPSDEELTQEIIDEYDNVRRYFIKHPDDEVVELFLRSYGNGDAWGVYQLVEDVFYNCSELAVKKALKRVLEDITIPDGTRYWVTQIAMTFNDEMLRDGLEVSLKSKNFDTRETAELAMNLLDQ